MELSRFLKGPGTFENPITNNVFVKTDRYSQGHSGGSQAILTEDEVGITTEDEISLITEG